MPIALEGAASAEVGTYSTTKLLGPSESDLAPVSGTPPRLRRTDEEQAGAEMPHLAFFGDNKSGIYFEMRSGELNGALPNRRIQLAAVPFSLTQADDGSVKAVGDMTLARFVTNNNGNEYRNANHPIAYAINEGNTICAEYNYQPNNGNDTKRYIQCFDKAGATVLAQTQIYAKNNDDCSMNQDATSTTLVSSAAGKNRMVAWRGCNGDGQDDGWLQSFQVNCTAGGADCSFKAEFDVSLAPREERTHGFCSVAASEPNTAICSWTEGNNQPQRDGTWLAAVDISPGQTGANKQSSILWKKQIEGRKGDGQLRTYSMRGMHMRVLTVDPTTKALVPSDQIIWRSGDVRGNNNTNNGKGGTYYGNQMAVMKVGAAGMSYTLPMTNVADKLLGLDGTHLGMGAALFGTTDKLVPGIVFLSGSQTGGGYAAKLRAVSVDTATSTIADLGGYSIAPYDRHLYPNYLGNNPGNQGRNYSGTQMIANPFLGQAPVANPAAKSKDAYLMITTTTGKDPADMMRPELKLSSYISVLPIAQAPAEVPAGSGSGSSEPDPTEPTDPTDPTEPTDPSTGGTQETLGGCSSTGGGSTGGAASLLLIGLAAFIRRRRS
ncbi:MAG: hypothetical protein H0T79_18780 [Deltaproteobacteria bacterium]|nr:hypothetical protein [Deltaproteobacteria bacterium]